MGTDEVDRAANILVVDDAEANRYLMATWLRRAGHDVVEAATGGAALDRMREPGVDVVLLDVNLPDINGIDVCERIKHEPIAAGVPVILVSATSVGVTDRTRGLSGGADAYLAEPIDPDELVATVQAMLRYSQARQRAERLAGRLATLSETTLTINAARSLEDLLLAAARGAARIFGVGAVARAADHDGTVIRVGLAGPTATPTVYRQGTEGSEPDGSLTSRVLHLSLPHDWRPVAGWAAPGAEFLFSAVRARLRGPSTVVAVPIEAVGSPVGHGIRGTDANRHLLSQLGQATALAVEALRAYAEERTVALTIQRSLLPRQLPIIKGADVAVHYVPAGPTAEIGGDFYEVAEVGGRLLVAIGDVTGHSLEAATVMAELRHALRAFASEGHPPAEILDRLDVMMRLYHPGSYATVLVLLIDPRTGAAIGATGGHPPPLLVTAEGTSEYLPVRGPLLGVETHRPEALHFTVPPGATLVLVTDGLIEDRRSSIDDGLERLQRASSKIEADLEEYCDRILRTLSGSPVSDDIAILALRRWS